MTYLGPDRRRILLVFTTVPWPLRAHGVSVRYLPLIRYLSRSHDIDLILICGRADDVQDVDGLRKHCRRIILIPDPRRETHDAVSKGRTYANFLLPSTPPISAVAHNGSRVTRGIAEAVRGVHYDALVWVGSYLLPSLFPALPSISVGRVLVDFIDSPYLWATRTSEAAFRLPVLARYDRWKTCRWEGGVIRGVDAAIYVSRVDAGAVPPRLAPLEKRHVVPNGVSLESYTAARGDLPSPNIGFLGNMGYPPNIEAVHWLYEKVYLPIRIENPGLSLAVIGKDPVDSVAKLGSEPGVVVTGTVEDIWPFVNSVDVFVFPLLMGAGLKNKILEAMGAGRPVITTAIGNEGIDAVDGEDIAIRETPEEFRMETVRLLRSPDARRAMGDSARRFVRDRFSWDRILPRYEEIVIGAGNRKQTDRIPS
jgi:glycosyltransferase involved in cell wall biosynthesis